jgi:cytochrome c oxidase subunit 2
MPPMLAQAPAGSLRVLVRGEQFWWRVHYVAPDGGEIAVANEIRLPVGEPAEFILTSPDVIHSFWIPALGGKMDMIPGRTNRLTLLPKRTGVFNGVCAEYCGASHALMAFRVVVTEKAEFTAWLNAQAQPAMIAAGPEASRGAELFLSNGCSACHSIRGTVADGVVGPDLTHVGSRLTLGAGVLSNDIQSYRKWLIQTEQIKPEVMMPHFGMLPRDELEAISAYLAALK